MHIYKFDEKNNTSNCIQEKVLETLVKSTGEGNKLVDKDFLEEDITKDKTTEFKVHL